MPAEFVMLPPQTERTREWGARLAAALPELKVVVAENHTHAVQVIGHADAAFGVIPPDLLRQAQRLRWLQAPQAAPPAGYYYPELIAHPVAITNFREIYNDHIGAHVMAFVLAFARGLHRYIPQQLKREWKKLPPDTGVVHLPEATALVVGVGGIGVFEQEPLPADHPLWTIPGVLLTPHTAGYGPYLDERRYEIILDNCRRFLAGQPLRNLVDKARWF